MTSQESAIWNVSFLTCWVFGLGIETALLVEALRQMQEGGHADFVGYFTATVSDR